MIKNQKILFFISLLLLNNSIGFAQLVINNTYTPTQLVQNILVGSGVTVSNISYTTGGAKSIGAFTNGVTTNLGLNSGIVLCTGYDSLIPNPATYFMSNSLGLPGDVDIDSISHQAQTYDACVLQFDFIPLSDTVKFRYVFGSEEYPKYVCSKYFDSFGFFVSGPGIAGPYSNNSINIALIPGTNFPVGINSVNNGTIGSGAGGGNCTGVGQSLAYKNYYVDNAALNGTTICFGGFTTPLTASCAVTPCKTYHVKLAVGEASNGLFDSGVFLEANSFSSPTYKVATSYSNSSSGNAAMEGCSSGIFSFTLPSATSSPYTIHYTIAGTATNGTDYPTIPDSITIPAGQDSAAIVITPILDGITEGKETVILNYTVGCTNLSDTVFIIDDIPLIPVASGDTIICPGNSATLLVSTTGGTIPYTYNWSNGAGTGTSATVTPASTTNYVITVTDKCGQTATDTATVTVAISPNVSITPLNPSICPGDSVLLTASSASAVSYSWSPSTGLSATTGAVVVANPTTSTTYIVTVYSANNCSATASVTVTISNNISVNVRQSTQRYV